MCSPSGFRPSVILLACLAASFIGAIVLGEGARPVDCVASPYAVPTLERVEISRVLACDANQVAVVCSLTSRFDVRTPGEIDGYYEYRGEVLDSVFGELLPGDRIRFRIRAHGFRFPTMNVPHLIFLRHDEEGGWLNLSTAVGGVIEGSTFQSYWPGSKESWPALKARLDSLHSLRDPGVLAKAADLIGFGIIDSVELGPRKPSLLPQNGSLWTRVLEVCRQDNGPDVRPGDLIDIAFPRAAACPNYAVGDTVAFFAELWSGWTLASTSFSLWRAGTDCVFPLSPFVPDVSPMDYSMWEFEQLFR